MRIFFTYLSAKLELLVCKGARQKLFDRALFIFKTMPSSEKFRDNIVAQFNGKLLEGGFRVTTRKMMGEYILYADGKIFGGIYDDRLLVKSVPAAVAMLPGAKKQLPYDGAKPMLRVTNEQIEVGEFWAKLLDAMLPELPTAKKK